MAFYSQGAARGNPEAQGILVRFIKDDQRWVVWLANKSVNVKPENLKAAYAK